MMTMRTQGALTQGLHGSGRRSAEEWDEAKKREAFLNTTIVLEVVEGVEREEIILDA